MVETAGYDSAEMNITQNKLLQLRGIFSQTARPLEEGYIAEKVDFTSPCLSALFILNILG